MKRVVTGSDAKGRDAILSSDVLEPIAGLSGSPNETRLCWSTASPIALPHEGGDPVAGVGMTIPKLGETRFMTVTIQPQSATPLHATPTLDYVTVVSGELWLVMANDDEVLLKCGDSVVQNGTLHIWANRSDLPAVIAAVMLGVDSA